MLSSGPISRQEAQGTTRRLAGAPGGVGASSGLESGLLITQWKRLTKAETHRGVQNSPSSDDAA
jgi:hypothetical protein